MANPGYIKTQLAPLGAATARVLGMVFEYVLANLKLGMPTHGVRATNVQWYCLQTTSPSVAGTEFSIEHGLGTAPYVAIPALDLTVAGGSMAVRVSRASDSKRIYLTCDDASAPVTVYVEAAS